MSTQSISPTPSGSGAVMFISGSETASGSAPNLSTAGIIDDSTHNINFRKRKVRSDELDYKKDFAIFRAELMSFFKDFAKTQNESMSVISEQSSEIKEEIKTIKSATDSLSTQFNEIKEEIKNIKFENTKTEHKFKYIEKELSELKIQRTSSEFTSLPNHEALICELRDRCDREKNIVIVGIQENNDKNFKSRRSHDEEEIAKILTLFESCAKPLKCMRLGKYVPGKNRPLKIFFNDTVTPKFLLRNKSKLPESIIIYSDKTPTQKQYLQSLKEKLKSREENGEEDLIIKYIKGTPTIVKNRKN